VSRSSSAPIKRTRPGEYLRKQAARREREQRAFDKQARRLVTWGRSR